MNNAEKIDQEGTAGRRQILERSEADMTQNRLRLGAFIAALRPLRATRLKEMNLLSLADSALSSLSLARLNLGVAKAQDSCKTKTDEDLQEHAPILLHPTWPVITH